MKAFRLARIASRPFQSATPRLQTVSWVKQSKPFPKVLSSISFHMSRSHWGGSFFVNTTCISLLKFVVASRSPSAVIGCSVACADDRENSRGANWLNYMPGNRPYGGWMLALTAAAGVLLLALRDLLRRRANPVASGAKRT